MTNTQILKVTVADDMESPRELVVAALERFIGSTYPVMDGRFIKTDEEREYFARGAVVELVEED